MKLIRINPSKSLFFGDYVKPWDQKDKGLGKNHCKCNMADEEGFYIESERYLPVFLASVLYKTEYFCQSDEGEGAAEANSEVINQSIWMLKSIRECRDIGTSDKEELFCPIVVQYPVDPLFAMLALILFL